MAQVTLLLNVAGDRAIPTWPARVDAVRQTQRLDQPTPTADLDAEDVAWFTSLAPKLCQAHACFVVGNVASAQAIAAFDIGYAALYALVRTEADHQRATQKLREHEAHLTAAAWVTFEAWAELSRVDWISRLVHWATYERIEREWSQVIDLLRRRHPFVCQSLEDHRQRRS